MWDLSGAIGDVTAVLTAAAAVVVAISIFGMTKSGVKKAGS